MDPDADKDRFAGKGGSAVPAPQKPAGAAPVEESKESGKATEVKTSVVVHAPPGGKSSISFG
jgi:hypothetical protein